ncbi:hypothetical protein [Burkholderia savannae]|uniref:hypothetical protein n=1 Tax=Burkholderia savannae TaxID=1637837 RepID=UPI0012F4B681|nr:hypothetical protein [Burkholderia savannae]
MIDALSGIVCDAASTPARAGCGRPFTLRENFCGACRIPPASFVVAIERLRASGALDR